jgi:hypothetical protein
VAAEWPEMDEGGWRVFGGLHRLLLRLAGRVPDEWLTHTRRLLCEGDTIYLPDTVTGGVAQLGVPLMATEVELLHYVMEALGSPGEELAAVEHVSISDVTPATDHRFYPAPPVILASVGTRMPASLDLTGGDSDDLRDLPDDLPDHADLSGELTDQTDQLVVDALAETAGVVGVWRAWRFGPGGPPKDGRPVYLVEVDPGVRAWDVAHDAQGELAGEGEESPQVEVYWTGDDLTPYHRAARAGSALLWARKPGRVRVAPVYDGVDKAGRPRFDAARPRLPDSADRERLLALLRSGVPVEVTYVRAVDVVDPARGQVVPMTYRTDGEWVWSEATPYYLAEHGLVPHTDLIEYLRTSVSPSTVDGVGRFRAEVALRQAGQTGA